MFGFRRRKPGNTAVAVANARAVHQILDGSPKILEDPVVLALLGSDAVDRLKNDAETAQKRARLRAHVVVRSRFAEDCLRDAVARGVRQYVMLGAGLDTFAWRQPEWARDLQIFEVDLPAGQAAKRQRLEKAGIQIPANLKFVPVDFSTSSLEVGLRQAGLRFDQPVFFSCLGVLMYLQDDAVDSVFRFAGKFAPSSEIVFTFAPVEEKLEKGEARRFAHVGLIAAFMGEPWLSRMDPDTLEARLWAFGFTNVSLLTAEETRERYFLGRSDGLPVPLSSGIARARV